MLKIPNNAPRLYKQDSNVVLFDHHRELVIEYLSGTLNFNSTQRLFKQLAHVPQYRASTTGFSCMLDATLDMSLADLKTLYGEFNENNGKTGKWAVLVNQPKNTALISLFNNISNEELHIEPFVTFEGAGDFLGLPPNYLQHSVDYLRKQVS